MRKMGYFLMGLFIVSLLSFTSHSFSQNEWQEQSIKGYDTPLPAAWNTYKASDMLWNQVRTPDGLYLAEISDLQADPATGRISQVVLSGIKNMGAEQIAVPFSAISKTGASIFVYDAPQDVSDHYGEFPFVLGFARYSPDAAPAGSFTLGGSIGTVVRDSNGKELGRIDDFVIDPTDGHVVYAVLYGTGGMDSKMAAIPFGVLAQGSMKGEFVAKTTDQAFLSPPAFDWRDMNNPRYAGEIYRHFGVQPYWE
jgi:sporulation protein YlmC with PRC-barrel domain